jgi:hypothetical protein
MSNTPALTILSSIVPRSPSVDAFFIGSINQKVNAEPCEALKSKIIYNPWGAGQGRSFAKKVRRRGHLLTPAGKFNLFESVF